MYRISRLLSKKKAAALHSPATRTGLRRAAALLRARARAGDILVPSAARLSLALPLSFWWMMARSVGDCRAWWNAHGSAHVLCRLIWFCAHPSWRIPSKTHFFQLPQFSWRSIIKLAWMARDIVSPLGAFDLIFGSFGYYSCRLLLKASISSWIFSKGTRWRQRTGIRLGKAGSWCWATSLSYSSGAMSGPKFGLTLS